MTSNPRLSELVRNYPASPIRKMFDLASGMEDILQFTLGEPDFDTPAPVTQAAKRSLDRKETHYVANAGIPRLREAIARRYREAGIAIAAENVIVTVGGMEALFLALAATVEPGSEVVVPDPGYPNYGGQILMVGAQARPARIREEDDFKPQAEAIISATGARTRAIIVNSPSNPLGTTIAPEEMAKVVAFASERGIAVISDEVYDALSYGGDGPRTALSFPGAEESVIVINSFSKTFAMTGWRVGYAVASTSFIRAMTPLQEGLVSCVPEFSQEAAVAALEECEGFVVDMRESYRRRRDLLLNELGAVPGVRVRAGEGAFYAFLGISETGLTSEEFCIRLLQEERVALSPGSAFGSAGEGYVRMSYATSEDRLREGARRIGRFVGRLLAVGGRVG